MAQTRFNPRELYVSPYGRKTASDSGVRARVPAGAERVESILLREAVEGIVSPEAAEGLLADALASWSAPFPETLAEARAFAAGPLDRLLRARGLDDEADEIADRMNNLLAHAHRQDEDDDEPTVRLPRASLRPVPARRVRVIVVGTDARLADALRDAPSGERLAVLPVTTEAALAGALHAAGPLVVIVDAATSTLAETTLAATLCARHAGVRVVVTSANLRSGHRIVTALARVGVRAVELRQPEENVRIIGDLVLLCGQAA